jgi:hypothetical protein
MIPVSVICGNTCHGTQVADLKGALRVCAPHLEAGLLPPADGERRMTHLQLLATVTDVASVEAALRRALLGGDGASVSHATFLRRFPEALVEVRGTVKS